jgi:polyribonucleotide nucleotidyltransferase
MSLVKEVEIGNKTIKFEFNKFAKQANGSVMVSCGGTQVLVTVCGAASPRPGQSFFPLTVDYIEKFYAVGRIPGGFFKREAKPSERETLTSRVIDRPLRPCFPEEYMCDTQILATVVSYDHDHNPAPLALIGASTALMISDIPFNGPVASLRLGMENGEYILDPDYNKVTDLDLTIACKPDAVLMVEAGANFLPEDTMIDAISHAHDLMKPLFDMQLEVQKEIGKPKRTVETAEYDQSIVAKVNDLAKPLIESAYKISEKMERYAALDAAKDTVKEQVNPDGDAEIAESVSHAFSKLKYDLMRDQILSTGQRLGGRGPADIRAISCEPGVLVTPHGSALFTRGETQALGTITLGSGDDEQRLDTIMTPDRADSFLMHYNFPPFSVGEARMLRTVSRREIGHGNLAGRALQRIIPDKSKFGYTIRCVSETLESNGSSSMAAVCSGCLALLDAGVPVERMVSGIAMGLIMEGDRYKVLSDILGDEDHLGDMDFKVVGDENGIAALQMDIKIGGLSKDIMAEALQQAKEGRKHILNEMRKSISEPNQLSENAPRIFHIKISPDKIRDVIGPGGKMIKKIVAETGAKVDIDDNGMISICSPDVTSAEAAKNMIRTITTDPEIGGLYLGTVRRIVDFGAFIEIKPGTDGLCHISELDNKRVEKVNDVLSEGEQVMVKVLDIDRQGKIKLSRKSALDQKPAN